MKRNAKRWLAAGFIWLLVPSYTFSVDKADSRHLNEQADSAATHKTDAAGQSLRNSMTWIQLPREQVNKPACVAFRKRFTLPQKAAGATLHIFADSRYILWINGEYVLRGPSRFNPKRPEYDTMDVRSLLREGTNTLAVLVTAGISNGRIMKHDPGLAVRLDIKDARTGDVTVMTDGTWRCSIKTRFLVPKASGACIQDRIDTTREKIDWVLPEFDDSSWNHAVGTDGKKWGKFYRRSIPLLRESEVGPAAIVQIKQPGRIDNTVRPLLGALPFEIEASDEMVIDIGRMAQAYWVLDFEADQATEFTATPFQTFRKKKEAEHNFGVINHYKARAGPQSYMSTDTYGFRYLHIHVKAGRIRLLAARFVDVTYPFDRLGSFNCSDPMLNELWDMATFTVQVCSEDAYVDCILRERAEWMGDGAVVTYPISRIAFAGPGPNSGYTYGDPRLIRNMLRHIALGQFEDGRIKASACTDAGDIHAYIEDYACLWVQSLRQYYDNTADKGFVREVWPVLTRQIKWFLDRRTQRGLVKAREFLLHMDNPLHHQEDCEGATLNAFIYGALKDAAYLAQVLSKKSQADRYAAAATALADAFNQHLWDPESKTYYAGIKEGKKIPPNRWPNEVSDAYWDRIPDAKEYPPTVQAALLALNMAIVADDRLDPVRKYLVAHAGELHNPYTHFFLFEELYKIGSDQADLDVLQITRKRWAFMVGKKDPGTLIEKFEFGSKSSSCHNFGSVPAYFLSAYVLGVRTDGAVWEKRIMIEPRLGDLKFAEGVVVTEHGLVGVSWKKTTDGPDMSFSFEIPPDVTAKVCIPNPSDKPTLILNGKTVLTAGRATESVQLEPRVLTLELGPGRHSGRTYYK